MKFLPLIFALQISIAITINTMNTELLYDQNTQQILRNAIKSGDIESNQIDSLKPILQIPYLNMALPVLLKTLAPQEKSDVVNKLYSKIKNRQKEWLNPIPTAES